MLLSNRRYVFSYIHTKKDMEHYMAWNEPGKNDKDPWSNQGNNNRPPDLERVFKSLLNKLSKTFGSGGFHSRNNKTGNSVGIWLSLLMVVVVVYFSTAIYTVDEKERAIILRFGHYHETVKPGLHVYFPPIDTKIQERVTELRTYNLRQQMLTEDENIVEVALSVQYNIADLKEFTLRVVDPWDSLEEATQSALRHVVGSSKMYQILTAGRETIGLKVKDRLQTYLNSYGVGLHVSKVNVESAHPPKEVQVAFDDVIRAREDEEREKNIAKVYANKIIPEARGKSQRMIEDANAYKEEVISRATGEVNRFLKLAEEYHFAPDVTRDRLYLETMEQIYSKTSKVIVNTENANNLMYLPLDKLSGSKSEANVSGYNTSNNPASKSATTNSMTDNSPRNYSSNSQISRYGR
jgi:membrane protease subunit HflK